MNRKFIPPLLALLLAVTACNIQTTSPTATIPIAAASTDTVPQPASTDTPFPEPAVPAGLTLDMLKNGSYHVPFYDRTVTLVNGSYSNDSSTDPYSVRLLDVVAFGDLNGDGTGDAAVVLVENTGGTGQFESLIPVLNSGGAPVQAGESQLGDRVRINAMTIDSGRIRLDMFVQGPNDPMCCASQPEMQYYGMLGHTFWLTRLTTQTPDKLDRSITIDSPADNADVNNPFTIQGSVTIAPFENNLASRIYLPDGTLVNETPLMVDSGGIMGGPGTFSREVDLSNAGITGPVIFQFLDLSAADGSTLALGSVLLNVH
jgi:hypothetical protein